MFTQPTRRQILIQGIAAASVATLGIPALSAGDDVPQTVAELWADFDPSKDPLETELIREWKEDGGVFRHVRFLIGIFRGKPARLACIFGFPENGGTKLPAVMHIHGGGQRAFLHEVKFLVSRGYATLSVNWGGSGNGKPPFNSPDGAKSDDPNTEWGAVDPSQLNVSGYNSILPGPKQFYENIEHPKNNNWYLLTLGCRRGLTFLEQQPQVDANRLGVHGYSMGGNLTMYVAGTDERVKVAVPGVGGQGWRWERHSFQEGKGRPQDPVAGDVELFRKTISFESYAPLIRCPVLHRSATNDFHGWMDDVYRTNQLIPDQKVQYSWSPHFNHRLSPEVEVTMPLWLDQFLRDGPPLPNTPGSELVLATSDRIPALRVMPAGDWPVARCEIYYSVDLDPRARFWRSADVVRDGKAFLARLPLSTVDAPLFAFSNVYHSLPQPISLNVLPGHRDPVQEVCLSSLFHTASPRELVDQRVVATLKKSGLIDDFSQGMRDWYQHNAKNLSNMQSWTRKLTDPNWRGEKNAKLKFTLKMEKTNRLTFIIVENEWRNYRGPKKTYVCEREIAGADDAQSIELSQADFQASDGSGAALATWDDVDQFGICAHYTERGGAIRVATPWIGSACQFVRLEWI